MICSGQSAADAMRAGFARAIAGALVFASAGLAGELASADVLENVADAGNGRICAGEGVGREDRR